MGGTVRTDWNSVSHVTSAGQANVRLGILHRKI